MLLQAKDKKFLCQLAKDKKYLEKLVSQMNGQKDSQSTVQGNIQKEVKTKPRLNCLSLRSVEMGHLWTCYNEILILIFCN